MSYLELDTEYGEDDSLQMLREEVHDFAKNEVRPAALEIDRLGRDEYLDIGDAGSPFREVMAQMKELGYHSAVIPEEFGGGGLSGREFHVMLEELAWGSSGFAIALGVDFLPATFASLSFDDEIQESFLDPYLADDAGRYIGCWGVTEPNHGSELVSSASFTENGIDGASRENISPPDITIEQDGDEWILNGVKASWVSAAPAATHCALHAGMDPSNADPGYAVLVPLDADGVTKGPPIDKLGQRDCPQGELVFDDVRVPDCNVVMTPSMLHPDTGYVDLTQILCITSSGMAAIATGLARAAFEEALAYAREREQSGKPICEHQSVKAKLYDMFEKVETCRAYSRRVCEHVFDRNMSAFEFDASHRHALAAQVYCKRTAFEVAHEAVQIHGANGITRDYPVEKLFRDARVKLIEDGTCEVLGLESADGVIENYEVG
ncbi:acyl-CoA dehydrogenase family protein [Halorientalis halophila]|uniref:acyl-CoA dehydrogenase family protein n=1 Tax=Halorientalis halophila TaxID=3108499 RepID=UPI003008E10E